MKFIVYLVVAVVAIIAGVIAFRLAEPEPQPQSVEANPAPVVAAVKTDLEIKTSDVLVAKSDIAVGTVIDQSMVERQPWPQNLLVDNFILGDNAGQEVVGKIVRSAISAREPFTKNKLANPNDPGFLAAALPVGMRAVTIATDAVAGVAGFVFPGDRVDLLFSHHVGDEKNTGGTPNAVEVLASNLKVLAVNVRDNNTSVPAGAPSSLTVEASEELAQQIRLAEKNGVLSFSLRSIHDDKPGNAKPTALKDLSSLSVVSPSTLVVRGPGAAGGKITVIDSSEEKGNSASSVSVVGGVEPQAGSMVAPIPPEAIGR